MHMQYHVGHSGQAHYFEHEWGLQCLLVLCACGVYRVRVVVLGACQVGTWHALYTLALGSVIRMTWAVVSV